MDKANGDAPFIPLYGTAVPGAGLDAAQLMQALAALGAVPGAKGAGQA